MFSCMQLKRTGPCLFFAQISIVTDLAALHALMHPPPQPSLAIGRSAFCAGLLQCYLQAQHPAQHHKPSLSPCQKHHVSWHRLSCLRCQGASSLRTLASSTQHLQASPHMQSYQQCSCMLTISLSVCPGLVLRCLGARRRLRLALALGRGPQDLDHARQRTACRISITHLQGWWSCCWYRRPTHCMKVIRLDVLGAAVHADEHADGMSQHECNQVPCCLSAVG